VKEEFPNALKKVLVYEGGKVDNPKDPGGRTNQGVTQGVFLAYLKSKGQKPRDVYTMKNAERDEIYKSRYWDQLNADLLPPGVGFVAFDGAVNSGVTQSGKWLQVALGNHYSGSVDGDIGLLTVNAVKAHPDHDMLIARMCQVRMDFLHHLKTWATFGAGWTHRVDNVRATGQAWAMGSVGPVVVWEQGVDHLPAGMQAAAIQSNADLQQQAAQKADAEDAKPLPSTATADVTTGVGGSAATIAQGISSTINDTKDQLSGFADIEFVKHVLLGLTLAGIVVAVGGILWRLYINKKKQDRVNALNLDSTRRVI